MTDRKYRKGISEPGLWQCTRGPEVDDMKALVRFRNTSKGIHESISSMGVPRVGYRGAS